jgi:nucleotide-binding universal stress UspA family protein
MRRWMQEIILRCLETDADRRYQSAAHIAFDLRHPEQVSLTSRANRVKRAPLVSQAVRWWRARDLGGLDRERAAESDAHVVMVAVDTMHPDDPRQPELQLATRRMLSIAGEYRLICVSVIPWMGLDASQQSPDAVHEHRIRLRHWVDPLKVPPERISLHVLEAADPADALVDFARSNHVDLIVLGAPAPHEMAFAWWRSVASTVTANADCTVHVVRRG